ncbi:hypothetical protein KY343_03120 [Candidatus Woesearchaeota archaeon]|nr:hypothetical protein [Candidatus Woesearchaeota archaeon]
MKKSIITKEIAELCGAILGDGHLHAKHNKITITGSLEDIYYYKERLIPLFAKYFNGNIYLRKRKDKNSYYFWIENKNIINFFLKIGFKRGNKSKSGIPLIFKNKSKFTCSFIRGLFDTDGCLKFSKQTKDYHYYPRIRLAFQESPLIYDLKIVLDNLNFKYGFSVDKRFGTACFEISGKDNLKKWMRLIGMNNPVHKSKYLFWKKFGKYIPYSTLSQRLKALNLNIVNIIK